jgi:hypothetical protein
MAASLKRTRGRSRRNLAFGEYQKREFDHIAQAHFKTVDSISSFFRYYLVVMSVPATAAAFLIGRRASVEPLLSSGSICLLGCILVVIAVVGLCLMVYLTNLRMDGILYARTVNAIRKYFYDFSGLHTAIKQRLRVLPISQHAPSYNELPYFGPVILVFALLDTSYFFAGSWLLAALHTEEFLPPPHVRLLVISSLLFGLLHYLR